MTPDNGKQGKKPRRDSTYRRRIAVSNIPATSNAGDASAAEEIFKVTYPALHRRMAKMRAKLEGREDQGRYWWELRPCAYYDAFERPKISYQVIQFYPSYSLDEAGRLLNDKGYMIASADPFLLAALNSPILWWYGWRYFPHMKDDALNPASFKMERLPIAVPSGGQSESAANLTTQLIEIHRSRHDATVAMADWLRIEWGIENPPSALRSPFDLSADAFAESLRKALPKRRKLTVAEVTAAKDAYATTVAPITHRLSEAAQHERDLAAVVNAAYGLTSEELAMVWRTAPPRMPTTPPASDTVVVAD